MRPHHHRNDTEHHGPLPRETRWGPISDQRPLSETGEIRLRQTRVRLHLHEAEPVEVALLDIRGATSFDDVEARVVNVQPITIAGIGGSPRMAFAAGVVLWAEVVADVLAERT